MWFFLLARVLLLGASELVEIPKGVYTPLYVEPDKRPTEVMGAASPQKNAVSDLKPAESVSVRSFLLDRYPVTRMDFLEFVRAHPQWRRSQVKRIFAEGSYLKDWKDDLDLGEVQDPLGPVRYVSWFAARAYCQAQGRRLPDLAEWEYVGAAYNEKDISKTILAWYSKPNLSAVARVGSTFENRFGVFDLHGLHWEWIEDFNSNLVTGESRADAALDQMKFCGASGLGSSDFKNYAAFMRFAFRSSLKAKFALANLGFRCAKDKEKRL